MTNDELAGGLLAHFSDLPDPRDPRGVRHPVTSLVVISLLAVICGANTYSAIREYAVSNLEWLGTFLPLPHGAPSQDTFERLFQLLEPDAWHARFLAFTQELDLPPLEGDEVVALDGKSARASGVLHAVSAWSTNYGFSLAQEAVGEGGNEITALPEVLGVLEAPGAVVTVDAIGAQKDVAWLIRERHAEYLLALKGNHPNLHQDVRWLFEHADELGWQGVEHGYARSEEKGHGRFETRECWVTSDLSALDPAEVASWRDLACVARVRSRRVTRERESTLDRYYLSSLPADAARVLFAARSHWGIENSLHWVLDVVFDEDRSRARAKNAQANWAALRRVVVSLLRQDKSVKAGAETKRLKAAWDRAYLLRLLKTATLR